MYAAARTREKLETSYADLAVWALQEVDRQLDEHPWVNWPREANTKLEEAYQTEMKQIEVSSTTACVLCMCEQGGAWGGDFEFVLLCLFFCCCIFIKSN